MNKTYLIIIFFSLFLNAQKNFFVEYEYKYDDGGAPIIERQFLISDSIKNFYYVTSKSFDGKNIDEQSLFKGINIKYSEDKLLEYKWKIPQKKCLTKDYLPTLKWNVVNVYKEVLGYKCQKAITTFRGREYEAYFTSDISINHGPWKFYGLPGLILAVKDMDGIFNFEAVKIINNSNVMVPQILKDLFNKFESKAILYKDYILEENKFLNNIQNQYLASLPKKTNITEVYPIRYFQLEKSFEWEETNKP